MTGRVARRYALIGGTGAALLLPAAATVHHAVATPWGEPSGGIVSWRHRDAELFYLPRHGPAAAIAPHRVNYRANIWALRELRPDAVIGINAVGGITPGAWPGRVVLPAQLIDYTWGREHSFFDGTRDPLRHIEFDPPFATSLRSALAAAARATSVDVLDGGTYGVTQGPRLETAAEIDRLAADGCDIVGMTAMPEAALAREAGLDYAVCAVVVNRAAGRLPPGAAIYADMQAHLDAGMAVAGRVLDAFFSGS